MRKIITNCSCFGLFLFLSTSAIAGDPKTPRLSVSLGPGSYIGMGMSRILSNDISYYFNIAIYGEGPKGKDYTDTLSPNNSIPQEDKKLEDSWQDMIFNVGATYGLSDGYFVKTGMGYVSRTIYMNRLDELYILSNDGKYSIEYDSDSFVNFNLGIGKNYNDWMLTLGYESYESIIMFELGYTLSPF